jgi:hypothetical protein
MNMVTQNTYDQVLFRYTNMDSLQKVEFVCSERVAQRVGAVLVKD